MRILLMALLFSSLYFATNAQTSVKKPSTFTTHESSTVDSSFVKLMKGLNQLLKDRVKTDFPKFSSMAYSDYVMIDKVRKVDVDSLYKYKLKDFKNITVSFEESPTLYGGKSEYGVIILNTK